MKRSLLFPFLFCLLSFHSFSQNVSSSKLYLKNTTITPADNALEWLSNYVSDNTNQESRQVIIQFYALPSADDKLKLSQNGISLLTYIPDGAFVALVHPSVNTAVVNAYKLKSIIEVNDSWKVENRLWKELANQQNDIELTISFHEGIARETIKEKIEFYGGSIINDNLSSVGVYNIVIHANKVRRFASWHGVEYIHKVAGQFPMDASSINAQKSNRLALPVALGGWGLTGNGVTIGVGDNTSGIYHTDLKDRVINYNPAPEQMHGIHTSGIAAGAGILDPKAVGVAPEATVVNQFYSAIWELTPEFYGAHTMTLTNNSYAAGVQDCELAGTYDNNSVAIDKFALQYDKVLHVFAGGNDGNLLCPPFPEGFSTISGSYQPAKNNIVVSSTDRYFENREVTGASGPVKDGRLKPEMSAVGANVYSGDVNDGYMATLGTSQASPQVLGALALLTERYKQLNAGELPAGDMLKAIVLNGTTDAVNPGPDFSNGFGFLNLNNSLRILNNKFYQIGIAGQGTQQQINIDVPANTAQLKVMLYWHDAPASPLASKALVNDLDLELRTPANALHLPLVLDPDPANVKENAVEKVDRLNNTEQVVISNPSAGSHTVTVRGFNTPTSSQRFVLAYDFIPVGLDITFPTAGCNIQANDTGFLYWEASEGTTPFTLEYSIDGGNNWILIDNNIPAQRRFYVWPVPAISSGNCRMRLSRNNTSMTQTTGIFVISPQPLLELDEVQCPGYMRIKWNAIPNAPAYEVMKKNGRKLEPVDTVTTTTYTFSGLPMDSVCIAAVRPLFNGIPGYRSLGLKRIPNSGSCAGSISDGDLLIERILRPNSGRKETSTALLEKDTLRLLVRNLDDVMQNNFRISYRINNASWTSLMYNISLNPGIPVIIDIPGINFSFFKHYDIRVAIENLAATDPVKKNDSVYKHVVSLSNDFINIGISPFTDSFEDMPVMSLYKDSMGVSPNEHWDYFRRSSLGHFRSFVNPGITIKGNRSVSLDAVQNRSVQNQNEFTGTFNIPFSSFSEIRCEFSYVIHGVPKSNAGNKVWTRGSDRNAWQELFTYTTDVLNIGKVQNSGSLSLTDALKKGAQPFSQSTQVKFEQDDTSVISYSSYGNGLTIDDVKIYTVRNDAEVKSIISPRQNECDLKGEVPLTVELYNGVSNSLFNVSVSYQFNNGPVVTEIIPLLNPKQTQNFTFSKKLNFSEPGVYTLHVWASAKDDSYNANDSILNYQIQNQPLIRFFPYKEDFETNNGYWYTTGVRSSWEFGTPASAKINTAGSGTKAWKTNLDGNYNNLETSYLVSPCFDVSPLRQPVFRMNSAMDIENCGDILCDAAYVEYSSDGANWIKLGTAGEGNNWYENSRFNVWSVEGRTYWQRSQINLPDSLGLFKLRFTLNTDLGLTKEGIAIDDIEIFDYYQPSLLLKLYPNPTRNGSFTIKWIATGGTKLELAITDVLGKQVHQQTETTVTDIYNEKTISLPHLPAGMYFIRCTIGDQEFTEKIVFL